MTTTTAKISEDVKMSIDFVRVKKADGTLYLMEERIAWMPNGKNSFTISHNYADIKTQKISPEGKPKIQLQVVLANGSDTFHFVHPNGTEQQLADRNRVKECLQTTLPLFRRKVSQEMEQKARLLLDNANLFELYKELVTTGVITPEDFWEHYATRVKLNSRAAADNRSEKVGVSSAFLADVKPQADGMNGIQYNINSEIIEAIFQTYPAVKRKHFECVPHKLTEAEFWQRFFQSHYFHRDRISSLKDFFNDCARQDEADIRQAIRKGITDPFFDLRVFDDQVEPTLENVLGGAGSAETSGANSKGAELSANQALIRRFNFHSIMVLDACRSDEERASLMGVVPSASEKRAKKAAAAAAATTTTTAETSATATTTTTITSVSATSAATTTTSTSTTIEAAEAETDEQLEQVRQQAKKRRLAEATEYDDLAGRKPAVGAAIGEFDEGVQPPPLKVANNSSAAARYMYGPTPMTAQEQDPYDYAHPNGNGAHHQTSDVFAQLKQTVDGWRPFAGATGSSSSHQRRPLLESQRALAALSDLSPTGSLMRDATRLLLTSANLQDELPRDILAELRQITRALDELLYHFWSCLPLGNAAQERKFVEMKETLDRFAYSKVAPLHERLSREFHRDLTSHLKSKLRAAELRFNNWNAKKQFHR